MSDGHIKPHASSPICLLAKNYNCVYDILNEALTKDNVVDSKHIFELKIREITNDNYIHRLKYEIEFR